MSERSRETERERHAGTTNHLAEMIIFFLLLLVCSVCFLLTSQTIVT